MSNFDATKMALSTVLQQIIEGKIQLPDFQRGWVWDDEHIRSLLVSIARSFPIGSIMLLEVGGEARFQIRLVEGVELPPGGAKAEHLILDGQQRLTSLTQALRLTKPIRTKDAQKREVARYYYIDIERALQGNSSLEDAIIGVDGSRTVRSNFGRNVELDLSTPEKEYQTFYFPCNQILNSDSWEEGLMAFEAGKFARYMEFRKQVLNRFREYQVPIIDLKKENSKEAVCLVFEKVNTGGVPLSVFELMTASYAADGFNLRDDWYGSLQRGIVGRWKTLAAKPLLRDIEPTDFLQGISLLHSFSLRTQDLSAGKSGKDVTPVSAQREQVLALPLDAYRKWADKLTNGFLVAERFLRKEGFRKPQFLPYRPQLVPLAAVMVQLGDRWLEPVVYDKIARWYWCGVFGELYSRAVESRIAQDVQGLLAWIEQPGAPAPTTVAAAGFQPARLDTMRTRTSAAYRGLYVLLQREGAKDFFWKAEIEELDQDDTNIDIHHVFPKDWCKKQGISDEVFNAIVNKTPISYKANRMIGGKAPSLYLEQIASHPQVGLDDAALDAIVATHLIDPEYLRVDDFLGYYQDRKRKLIDVVEKAMGKAVIAGSVESPADEGEAGDELEIEAV